ncbi:hypothetical protein IMZ08_14835 [Bacillus luteolus]|uniref:Intracellular proteinase inhibitor n=1 Tax=Litchfieldia luteola TaxID=682179 RepID=A0ABR9QLK5_9BACI|nr:BsuPI-related putative proteinase inhibitor [Cytobacillus luteolus]MBE4909324.1 hypothetical protein [Cytobacillus luteolus]MBP1940720.1 hypothetical protein [Cytobacillus luteolus]
MKQFFLLFIMSIVGLSGCATQPVTTVEEGEDKVTSNPLQSLETSVDIQAASDSADIYIKVKNNGEEDVTLTFTSGQTFEVVVVDGNNNEVYRFSTGKMFTMALQDVRIKAGEEKVWKDKWRYLNEDGQRVKPGEYKAIVSVVASKLNGNPIGKDKLRAVKEFTIPEQSTAFRNVTVSGKDGEYVVKGEARVHEATFFYAVEDGHDYIIKETVKTAKEGAPTWSQFEFEVNIPKEKFPINGVLLLVLYERSAKDDEVVNSHQIVLQEFR